MIWSPANSQSYAFTRAQQSLNRGPASFATALEHAECTSDCVVKGRRNSGYCGSQCRFASPPSVLQINQRAALPKVYPPALDYQIPFQNYNPQYNGYPVPTFPRAVRLMRGNASPQTSPINNIRPPLDGIGVIGGGVNSCFKIQGGQWVCPRNR